MLWKSLEEKLIKSKRKYEYCPEYISYRFAYLFCEECGKKIGRFDIVDTNLETYVYCDDCATKFIRQTPIKLDCGTVIKDYGNSVDLKYENNYYKEIIVDKVCYFNKKGRYIKVKGKRFYI